MSFETFSHACVPMTAHKSRLARVRAATAGGSANAAMCCMSSTGRFIRCDSVDPAFPWPFLELEERSVWGCWFPPVIVGTRATAISECSCGLLKLSWQTADPWISSSQIISSRCSGGILQHQRLLNSLIPVVASLAGVIVPQIPVEVMAVQ